MGTKHYHFRIYQIVGPKEIEETYLPLGVSLKNNVIHHKHMNIIKNIKNKIGMLFIFVLLLFFFFFLNTVHHVKFNNWPLHAAHSIWLLLNNCGYISNYNVLLIDISGKLHLFLQKEKEHHHCIDYRLNFWHPASKFIHTLFMDPPCITF